MTYVALYPSTAVAYSTKQYDGDGFGDAMTRDGDHGSGL